MAHLRWGIALKRFLTYLIILLIAAALNYPVAWLCILWSPYNSVISPPDPPDDGDYPPFIIGPYGQKGWWFISSGFGVWQAVSSGARGGNGHFLYFSSSHTPAYYRGGLPMLSLQSVVVSHGYKARWDLPRDEIIRRGLNTSDLPGWMRVKQERRLPIMPHWPGFAVNTAFYFIILALIRFVWVHVRKDE